MLKAIIFSDRYALDFSDIRHNVVRIPEVFNKVKEAQEVLDELGEKACFHEDLFSVLSADNSLYNKNRKLKAVLTTLVQWGLFDRYIRKNGWPSFLLGDCNAGSPLSLCSEKEDLKSLLQKDSCESIKGALSLVGEDFDEQPLLSGITMSAHHIYEKTEENTYEKVGESNKDMGVLVQELIEDYGVKQLIDIGPGSGWVSSESFDHSLYDVQVLESIDMDPMLSWFWPYVKNHNQKLDLAN